MAGLHLVGSDIVFANPGKDRITVVDGQFKKCLAFGVIEGGLIVILREGSDGITDKKRSSRRGDKKSGGKTANGTPVSIDAKRTLSVCSFDASSASVSFHTHVSVDGWTSLVTNQESPFVILSDYNTAHSEVLEWTPSSKTLRRVWEGKGSCPHHFKAGGTHYILLLLYTARRFILCDAKTMKQVAECSANGRDKDITDVLGHKNRAIVVYGSGACSVFGLAEDNVKRLVDLGKVLGGKIPTHVAPVDDTDALIIYRDDFDEVCLLEPKTEGAKETYEKSKAAKALFKSNIEAARSYSTGGNTAETIEEKPKDGKKETKDTKNVAEDRQGTPAQPASPSREAKEDNGIGLLALIGITTVAMAVTAAVMIKVSSK